jgi:hypothetical protein
MASTKGKRSIRRAQPAHVKAVPTQGNPGPFGIEHQHKISHLPQVKGKTLESLEFISAPDYKGISLGFRDKTFLDLKIETFFTVKADYMDQKTGKHRVLKRWPRLHRR